MLIEVNQKQHKWETSFIPFFIIFYNILITNNNKYNQINILHINKITNISFQLNNTLISYIPFFYPKSKFNSPVRRTIKLTRTFNSHL